MNNDQVYTGKITAEELGASKGITVSDSQGNELNLNSEGIVGFEKNEEVHIDEEEMVEFIHGKLSGKLSREDVAAILDLELEFLKIKGVVGEIE